MYVGEQVTLKMLLTISLMYLDLLCKPLINKKYLTPCNDAVMVIFSANK